MKNISRLLKKACDFWKKKVGEKKFVVRGREFPDEYVRKILQKEGLILLVRKGWYLLKNKGDDAETLLYRSYWLIIEKLMEDYAPWAIEKESALALYLGDESIPRLLKIRTHRKINYSFSLPFDLKIQIHPDSFFHEETRRRLEIGRAQIFIDVPEKVLFSIRNLPSFAKKNPHFTAFIKSMKFDRRFLEVLYAENPKPVAAKRIVESARKCGREDLAFAIGKIIKEYTVYRQ